MSVKVRIEGREYSSLGLEDVASMVANWTPEKGAIEVVSVA